jgi:hypothetical protein
MSTAISIIALIVSVAGAFALVRLFFHFPRKIKRLHEVNVVLQGRDRRCVVILADYNSSEAFDVDERSLGMFSDRDARGRHSGRSSRGPSRDGEPPWAQRAQRKEDK